MATLPSGEDLQSALPSQFGDSTIVEHASDDERGVVIEDHIIQIDAPCEEKPKLSWTLTLSLLVIVTVVRLLLLLLSQPTYSLLVGCHRRGMARRIHG